MSLASWKKEYYPQAASKCSKKNALLHSLRKWEGLLPANLKKHGIVANDNVLPWIEDEEHNTFEIGAESCALCHHYFNRDRWGDDGCTTCPIMRMQGRSCDRQIRVSNSAYGSWLYRGDPKPMIKLLKKTLAWSQKEGKK